MATDFFCKLYKEWPTCKMETCSWLLSLFFKLCTMLVCLTLILTWLRQRLKVIRFSFDDERYQLQSNEAHHVHLMLESDSCCIPPVYTVPPGPLKSLWDRNFGMRCWGLSLEPSVTHRFLQLHAVCRGMEVLISMERQGETLRPCTFWQVLPALLSENLP